MDVLADVLAVTSIGNTIFSQCELKAPWGVAIEPAAEAGFHIVGRGAYWLRLAGESEPVQLATGDVVLLPHGSGHYLSDTPDTPVIPLHDFLAEHDCDTRGGPAPDDTTATLICGVYTFEHEGPHPLLSLLPPMMHLPALAAGANVAFQETLRLLLREVGDQQPGHNAIVSRLVDVLFVQIIRAWLDNEPQRCCGWLGALRDPQVGQALALMHQEPERRWNVELLAREVSMSRSAFAQRFREQVGQSPMAYLTHWRMDLAARLLRESAHSLRIIADQVGYDTEYSFSKAFRRQRNESPGRYRRRFRAQSESGLEPPEIPPFQGTGRSDPSPASA